MNTFKYPMCFFENGTVGLYDFSKNTILRFNLKGQLLSVQRCDISEEDIKPFHIYPWNNGYIVLNSYGGESTDRKTLCFLNKELTSGKPIKGGLYPPDFQLTMIFP